MNYQGMGGGFLYARDPDELAAWYQSALGVPLEKMGSMWWVELPSSDRFPNDRVSSTTFAIMKSESAVPAVPVPRLNHRVVDLDVALARLKELNISFEGPQDDYGRFAWCTDPEGHRVELWEPPVRSDALAGPVSVVGADARLATAEVGDEDLVFTRTVSMDVESAWRLWTTSEGLESWLCPAAKVELRIGGPFEIYFMPDAPEGERGSDGCKVLSFLKNRMLSFTWNAPPSIPETRSARTFVVVEWEPKGDKTLVTLTHSGWPTDRSEGRWNETYAYFGEAWKAVMEAFERA